MIKMSTIEAFNEKTQQWETHHITELRKLKIDKMYNGRYSQIIIIDD